jgi:DNA helicase-2/ATP-dependent DNA helicase PcrA
VQNLGLVEALEKYSATGQIRGPKRNDLISEVKKICSARLSMTLSGDPTADWLAVQSLFDGGTHDCLKTVAQHARHLRLLNRGTQLRESLAEQWRSGGSCHQAREVVSTALLQEHFSNSTRVWKGVNLMTIHKSKGKEFDEVVVFEGSQTGRLLPDNATARDVEQARLALRVAVTRSRQRTILLTPERRACTLLCN